jgi:hypothetical protein
MSGSTRAQNGRGDRTFTRHRPTGRPANHRRGARDGWLRATGRLSTDTRDTFPATPTNDDELLASKVRHEHVLSAKMSYQADVLICEPMCRPCALTCTFCHRRLTQSPDASAVNAKFDERLLGKLTNRSEIDVCHRVIVAG